MSHTPTALPGSRAFVGTLALLATSVALANQESVRLADTVVTAAGYEQKITDAPASISVISQEDLQRNRYSNLAQALDGVEGVDIRQGTGKTGGLNISLRGMPSEYTLILIDGRRQNPGGDVTPNGFGDTNTSFMPPMSAIERIEVIRGPMSTLYGSDAIGGVVNIITKKVSNEWGATASIDHVFQEDSDYGESSRINLYTSGPLVEDLVGLTLRGSFYDREASDLTFSDGSNVSKRGASPVEGENFTVGTRLNFTPGDQHSFFVDFERGVQTYNNDDCQLGTLDGRAGGNAIAGCTTLDPDNISGYKDELKFERNQVVLGHEARLGFGQWSNTLTRNVTETLGRTIPGDGVGTPYDEYPSIIVGNDRELKSTDLIFDTKLVAPVGDSHITTVGAQWWDIKTEDGIAPETFDRQIWALFAENEWRMRDDLALTLGGRYEDHDAFGGHFSPRAYLVWNTTDNWTLKGGVSRGYKTPSVNALHGGVNGLSNQGQVATVGNPDLDPEISTNTEFGIYYDNLANFNANLTVFHNKFKDKIQSTSRYNCNYNDENGDEPIQNPPPADCYNLVGFDDQGSVGWDVNVDEAVTQGVEVSGKWQFAPAWSIRAHYTYTDSEQKSGENKGAPLTNTPEHLVTARLTWDATAQASVWLQGEYRSERERFLQNYENLSGANKQLLDAAGDLKAYEVFSLGGTFRATENLSFNAAIYNLLDKDFTKGTSYTLVNGSPAWVSDYIQTGRSVDGTLEEGRRLWVSATYDF
ncbi:MAG: TonB-dependent receptor [Gammaproteobacteria bacterium]|nr:TonB-dependent receptor [Gammaproteobacteria bacterium]